MIESPLAKVSWPRVHMPEVPKPHLPTSPWPKKSETSTARNTWVEPTPEPPKPSPLQTVKDGAHKVGQGTRAAWDKTVDFVTPGPPKQSSARVARRNHQPTKPSMWKKMFGMNEPSKEDGSQTISQFIAQDRVDENTRR
jgi:hypothetical protein